ncbi:hypothetical protein E5Q_05546 [Mixia osmundae IAM 14324]|uniref:Adenine DNA glycosylase n=1 Tax=Mixia osmundae (strain CBS 9802 / IAM 14324 / JCM 22182 / KY 12970) TaxID=764103 RepID=G7E7P8_MIXOS|nr:hypothetical protein E5Q_05546 [Mixia osmundae IAM 14324]
MSISEVAQARALVDAALSTSTRVHRSDYHRLEAFRAPKLLHEALLSWYDTVKETRSMPWRKELSREQLDKLTVVQKGQRAYETWVSEIMLQQTQVATVIPYYNRWMAAFPTVTDLAQADIEQVNAIWSGLGYYSRASRLLSGAKKVVGEFDGVLPSSTKKLEQVDGIGPYSAGAIASIAFGKAVPMVDGNIHRVLARFFAIHAPQMAKPTTNAIWSRAKELVPDDRPGEWNQALMELGATVCTPKSPSCDTCPLSAYCRANLEARGWEARTQAMPKKSIFSLSPARKRARITSSSDSSDTETSAVADIEADAACPLCAPIDLVSFTAPKAMSTKAAGKQRDSGSAKTFDVTIYPMAKDKKVVRKEDTACLLIEWCSSDRNAAPGSSRVLLVRRPDKGLLAGLWEFICIDLEPNAPSDEESRRALLEPTIGRFLPGFFESQQPLSQPDSDVEPAVRIAEKGSATQVYTHQTRQYHLTTLVITSDVLPRLAKASKPSAKPEESSSKRKKKQANSEDEADVIPELRWVSRTDLPTSNVGGAMLKLWDLYIGATDSTKPKPAAKQKAKNHPHFLARLSENGLQASNKKKCCVLRYYDISTCVMADKAGYEK